MAKGDRRFIFADQYLIDFDGQAAAIRAGYSKNSAAEQAYQILRQPEIIEYLAKKKEELAKKLNISAERTLQEIARIAFYDIRKLYEGDNILKQIADIDDDTAAAINSVEVDEMKGGPIGPIGITKKVKMSDKTKALEMLAKHFNIYKDVEPQKLVLKIGYGKDDE